MLCVHCVVSAAGAGRKSRGHSTPSAPAHRTTRAADPVWALAPHLHRSWPRSSACWTSNSSSGYQYADAAVSGPNALCVGRCVSSVYTRRQPSLLERRHASRSAYSSSTESLCGSSAAFSKQSPWQRELTLLKSLSRQFELCLLCFV